MKPFVTEKSGIALILSLLLVATSIHAMTPEALAHAIEKATQFAKKLKKQVKKDYGSLLAITKAPQASLSMGFGPMGSATTAQDTDVCTDEHMLKIDGTCYTKEDLFENGSFEKLMKDFETYPFPPIGTRFELFVQTEGTITKSPKKIVIVMRSPSPKGGPYTYKILPPSSETFGRMSFDQAKKEALVATADQVSYSYSTDVLELTDPDAPLASYIFDPLPNKIFCLELVDSETAVDDLPNLTPVSCRTAITGKIFKTQGDAKPKPSPQYRKPIAPYTRTPATSLGNYNRPNFSI